MPEVMSIEVDEEFDPRPPQTPFGLRGPDGNLNIPLIAGIATAIVLVLLLIFVVWRPFASDTAPPASNWSPKDPTKDLKVLAVYPADDPLVTSLQASLESWATFYTTGDLDDLKNTFDLAGPQYALLVKEQSKVAAKPESGPPAVILLSTVGKVTQNDTLHTVRTTITWTKPGGAAKVFDWDIIMRKSGSDYLLNRADTTKDGVKKPIDFCGSINLIAELDTDEEVSKQLESFEGDAYIEKLGEVIDVRIKTWEYLQQVAAGTDDQAAVDAIMEELQAYNEAINVNKNIEEFQKVTESSKNESNYEHIIDRADVQCSVKLDIKA